MYDFVFHKHLRLVLDAMLLFVVGLFVSWPVVHYRLHSVARLPLAVFRAILHVMGRSPSLLRMSGVIFSFNSLVMFLYMAAGFHPLLPMVLGICTGMNIGIIMGLGKRERETVAAMRPGPGQWIPRPELAAVCAPAVLLIELPCFWLSIAMGISMGHAVQSGASTYLAALAVRSEAYVSVVLPLLLVSAVAETVAVRGAAADGE